MFPSEAFVQGVLCREKVWATYRTGLKCVDLVESARKHETSVREVVTCRSVLTLRNTRLLSGVLGMPRTLIWAEPRSDNGAAPHMCILLDYVTSHEKTAF